MRLAFRLVPGAELGSGIGASLSTPGAVAAAKAIRFQLTSLVSDGTLSGIFYHWFDTTGIEVLEAEKSYELGSLLRYLQAALVATAPIACLLCWQTMRFKKANLAAENASRNAQGASRAKGEFLANMSYEIRTPMNAYRGNDRQRHAGRPRKMPSGRHGRLCGKPIRREELFAALDRWAPSRDPSSLAG